jgi:poly-gamma-glutamate synthesis protein (capsule biosynthesis protein)
MNATSRTLWKAPNDQPIAARVAVAGDFLPAGPLIFAPGTNWGHMAQGLAGHFSNVTTTFTNLEACVDVNGLASRPLVGLGQAVSAPAACLEYLQVIRTQAAGIANNHIYDFGQDGLDRTRDALSRIGIIPMGAGIRPVGLPMSITGIGPVGFA